MSAVHHRFKMIADGLSLHRAQRWLTLSAEVTRMVDKGCELWRDPDLHLLLTAAWQNVGDLAFDDLLCRSLTDRVRGCSQSDDCTTKGSLRRKLSACAKHDPTGANIWADSASVVRLKHADTIVVGNHGDLFSDFLPKSLLVSCAPNAFIGQLQVIQTAISSIELFDSDLVDDFKRLVCCIAVVNPGHTPGFSCRMDFLGCIFADARFDGGDRVAETLIHEYMHQVLWISWTEDHPLPFDLRGRLLISPVTGNERSLETLLQAYAIYAEAIRYYAWLQTLPNDIRARSASKRLAHLEISRARLATLLRQHEDAVRFCNLIDEIWPVEPISL
jgi:hypothetical protein